MGNKSVIILAGLAGLCIATSLYLNHLSFNITKQRIKSTYNRGYDKGYSEGLSMRDSDQPNSKTLDLNLTSETLGFENK